MHGYNFTERVRKVLAFAREEAAALGHQYVGTEHILLALVREGDGVAMTVIENLHVTGEQIRTEVLEIVRGEAEAGQKGMDLPYTSRAKKSLELAMSEARGLDHNYVGTEHLLLGLLREASGPAAGVLTRLGITTESARAEVRRILGDVQTRFPTWGGAGDRPDQESSHTVRFRRAGGVGDALHSPPDPLAALPQPIRGIIVEMLRNSKDDGRAQPDVADLLWALIFSSREAAAVFASREIDVHGLVAEIRGLTERDPPAGE